MKDLNILIVEGNLREENDNFIDVGIPTHTDSLKESLNHLNRKINYDVVKKQHSFKKYNKLLCFFCNLFNFLLLHSPIQVCFLYLMNIH